MCVTKYKRKKEGTQTRKNQRRKDAHEKNKV